MAQLFLATVQPLKCLLQGCLEAVGLEKLAVFFPGNMAGLEKPIVLVSPLYSVQSACLQAVFLNV